MSGLLAFDKPVLNYVEGLRPNGGWFRFVPTQ